jgi:hypothetical protein
MTLGRWDVVLLCPESLAENEDRRIIHQLCDCISQHHE